MLDILQALLFRGVRRYYLLWIFGAVSFVLGAAGLWAIATGFGSARLEWVATGTSLVGAVGGFLLLTVLFVEMSRSSGGKLVAELREARFRGVVERVRQHVDFHRLGSAPSVAPTRDAEAVKRIGNYQPRGALAQATDEQIAAYRRKWSAHVVGADHSMYFVYDHQPPRPGEGPRGYAKLDQPVRVSLWQNGDELRLGVFFERARLDELIGAEARAELESTARGLFFCSPDEVEEVQRHELDLVQRVVRRERMLGDAFFWDAVAAEAASLSVHVAIALFEALAAADGAGRG